jgi:heparin/heparan-sulfate lyase
MKLYDSSNLPLFGGRFSGHYIFVMSEVYDWLYDSFTKEERDEMIALCERSAHDLEMKYPPFCKKTPWAVVGHDNEAQLLRDMISFSIAVYDERPDIYDYCAGLFFDKFLPTYNTVNENRMHIDGVDYGSYRSAFIYWTGLLFASMTGERIYTEGTANIAEWLLYTLRSDGQALRIGDAFLEDKGGYTLERPFVIPMFLAGAYTGNENYRKYFFDNYFDEYMLPSRYRGKDFYRDGGFGEGMYTPVVHLIWNRFTEPKDTPALPNAKHFSTPIGATFFRDDKNETLVFMKAGEYGTTSHDHMDTGSFQIYHRGILASDSGAYHRWGSDHFRHYSTRTVAHNCILIEDDNEKIYKRYGIDTKRDGGIRFVKVEGPVSTEHLLEHFNMSHVIEHRESEDGCYLKVDMLPAYSEFCDKIVREMTFDTTRGEYGVFTVRDEIETKDESLVKKFLLHCQKEPTVDGNEITIENKGGRLVCRVIEPAECKIEIIGGEGKRFLVDGVNYEDECLEGKECGWGRIEISPKNASKRDTFLVEMEIKDAD